MKKMFGILVAACSLVGNFAAPSVVTAANLVTDGDFANFSSGAADQFLAPSFGATGVLADWTYGGGVAAVYKSGDAISTGATQGSYGQIYLWGVGSPAGGSANSFDGTSPDGGNILASDGDHSYSGLFSQTVSGLTAGHSYTLSFNYAAAQFEKADGSAWDGATDEVWHVNLGSSSYATTKLNIGSHGFSGWQTASFTYTAADSNPVILSFLADSTASGLPPVALLNDVQLTPVPEPTSLSLLVIGSLVGAGYVRTRRKAVTA